MMLDGADVSRIPRYVDLLEKNAIYQQDWMTPSKAHDAALGAKQREWLNTKSR
jgi:hypothetical protein